MTLIDLLGYTASLAVLTSFCMSRIAHLRLLALASNVLFAAYGYVDHLTPVLILHTVLFPINLVRLLQIYWKPRRTLARDDLANIHPFHMQKSFRHERST